MYLYVCVCICLYLAYIRFSISMYLKHYVFASLFKFQLHVCACINLYLLEICLKRLGITGMDRSYSSSSTMQSRYCFNRPQQDIHWHLAILCPTCWCSTAGCQTPAAAPGLAVASASKKVLHDTPSCISFLQLMNIWLDTTDSQRYRHILHDMHLVHTDTCHTASIHTHIHILHLANFSVIYQYIQIQTDIHKIHTDTCHTVHIHTHMHISHLANFLPVRPGRRLSGVAVTVAPTRITVPWLPVQSQHPGQASSPRGKVRKSWCEAPG